MCSCNNGFSISHEREDGFGSYSRKMIPLKTRFTHLHKQQQISLSRFFLLFNFLFWSETMTRIMSNAICGYTRHQPQSLCITSSSLNHSRRLLPLHKRGNWGTLREDLLIIQDQRSDSSLREDQGWQSKADAVRPTQAETCHAGHGQNTTSVSEKNGMLRPELIQEYVGAK